MRAGSECPLLEAGIDQRLNHAAPRCGVGLNKLLSVPVGMLAVLKNDGGLAIVDLVLVAY